MDLAIPFKKYPETGNLILKRDSDKIIKSGNKGDEWMALTRQFNVGLSRQFG